MKLAIIILSYKAEKTITKLLDEMSPAIKKKAKEIILFDDASPDKTYEKAVEYNKLHKLKKFIVRKNQINLGYGGNQKLAYNYCIKKGYDTVVMLHGDLQYTPRKIPELIKPFEEGKADFVYGSRMTGHPLKGGMPLWKFFGNRFLTLIENIAFNLRLSEYHSGFRAYNLNFLKKLNFNANSNNYVFDTQIIAQIKNKKGRIAEITIPTFYFKDAHQISFKKACIYGLSIFKVLCIYLLNKIGIKNKIFS